MVSQIKLLTQKHFANVDEQQLRFSPLSYYYIVRSFILVIHKVIASGVRSLAFPNAARSEIMKRAARQDDEMSCRFA